MNRIVTTLLVVLLIQCGIAAIIFWPRALPEQAAKEEALAPFASERVDEIRIGDEFDNEAVLIKSGDQWRAPEMENLPVDSGKVEALLQGIIAQALSWPIGSSAAARQRFQVADYRYQRRLSFYSAGEKLGAIFLGTSPGFRKVHARNESQDAIYAITFNAFDAPAVNDAWLDPGLLQARTVLRIDADLYSVNFENGTWVSGTGHAPDQNELDKLIAALRTLQIEGVADQDTQRDLSVAEADLVLAVTTLAGEVTLELFTLEGRHYIQSSEFPLFFNLSAGDYDQLTSIDVRLITGEAATR